MTQLPVADAVPALRAALRDAGSAVLQAPPGAGKSTYVPLALLDEAWLTGARIVMLEPRRLAARAVARRMAQTLGEAVGETVGYRVRRDTRVSRATRIEVVTEGVLTRMLQRDPTLEGTGLVIFDEFHERSIHADLGLALTLHSRALVRPELRILVMSATLDGERVARLLGGAPVISSEGRTFPVDVRYRERAAAQRIEGATAAAVRYALAHDTGDVLVFLPGGGEIRRVADAITDDAARAGARVAPLYGDLPQDAQDAAIAPSARGERKVVLATPIAETSLTIEGVRVVIDSGLARAPRFSARTGMTRLETARISRASSEQRCGRAGRVAPGICYRLWNAAEQHALIPHTLPEILQTDLAALALELAAAGIDDATSLRWIDAPPSAALGQARSLLVELGAVDARTGSITAHGRAMAELPLHPRLAHMLLAAERIDAGAVACDIAALLGERDILRGAGTTPDADLRIRLELLRARGERAGTAGRGDVDATTLRRARSEADALRRQLGVGTTGDDIDQAGIVIAFAYPDRVAQRRDAGGGRFLLRSGGGAVLTHPQALTAASYIVAAELGGETPDARIFLAAAVEREDIEAHFADQISREDELAWDDASARVRATRRERLGAIVLRETRGEIDPERAATILLDVIRRAGPGALQWTEDSRQLRERIAFLHAREPERWPDVSDDALLASLDTWLAPQLAGMTTMEEVRSIPLTARLVASLDHAQRVELDRRAPTHYIAPTGTRAMIDYSDPGAPAIEIRLQELFGVATTPSVDRDRVPLTLRLLSPARRPVQVTRDLPGFWRGSYAAVRKEMKGRYPKHPWPDDPFMATPTRRTKRSGE